MSTQNKRPPVEYHPTTKLDIVERRTIVVPGIGRFGYQFAPKEVMYHAVPYNFQTLTKEIPWRVQLKFGAPTPKTIVGLDIYGDVAIGRGKDGEAPPDLDLTELDALKLGVSRRHALLRPTHTKLVLMDLGSTNGTFLNAMPVGQGIAKAVKSGDMITLGDLGLVIEILSNPPVESDEKVDAPTVEKSEEAKLGEGKLEMSKDGRAN